MEPRHPFARGELPHMTQDTVVSLVVSAMELALKVGAPILLVGLVVGLAVSIFQAVTQIQEQTLSFIPKIVGHGRADRHRRPVDARPARHLDAAALRRHPEHGRADERQPAARRASPSSRSPASCWCWRASRRCSSSRRCSPRSSIPARARTIVAVAIAFGMTPIALRAGTTHEIPLDDIWTFGGLMRQGAPRRRSRSRSRSATLFAALLGRRLAARHDDRLLVRLAGRPDHRHPVRRALSSSTRWSA